MQTVFCYYEGKDPLKSAKVLLSIFCSAEIAWP